jgi:hypothetical protein
VVFKTRDKEELFDWQVGAPVWEKEEGAYTAYFYLNEKVEDSGYRLRCYFCPIQCG